MSYSTATSPTHMLAGADRHEDLSDPARVMRKLVEIEHSMAIRQNAYEDSARRWHGAQRDIGKISATALLTADEKTVTEKKARGVIAAYDVEGADAEGEYEALKAAMNTYDRRASILQSVLKAQGRI